MKNIKVELTLEELLLLSALASDQLFRREFIDPKIPGYKGDPVEVTLGKDLVLRLRDIARQASASPGGMTSKHAPSHLAGHPKGGPDAV